MNVNNHGGQLVVGELECLRLVLPVDRVLALRLTNVVR